MLECVTGKVASEKPTIDIKSVISKAEQAFNGKYNGCPAAVHYLARPDGSATLVHAIQIQNEEVNKYEVYVDAHSGEILSATDFVAEASVRFFLFEEASGLIVYGIMQYTVLPVTERTLTEGLETLTDPQDTLASSLGWHNTSTTTSTTTAYVYFPSRFHSR